MKVDFHSNLKEEVKWKEPKEVWIKSNFNRALGRNIQPSGARCMVRDHRKNKLFVRF